MPGTVAKELKIRVEKVLGPLAAVVIAMASRMLGKESMMSMIPTATLSTQPPT